jgi:hypothetical protein
LCVLGSQVLTQHSLACSSIGVWMGATGAITVCALFDEARHRCVCHAALGWCDGLVPRTASSWRLSQISRHKSCWSALFVKAEHLGQLTCAGATYITRQGVYLVAESIVEAILLLHRHHPFLAATYISRKSNLSQVCHWRQLWHHRRPALLYLMHTVP